MGIILDNVSYTYQEGTPFASAALSDVNLSIEDGSYTAIIGHYRKREIYNSSTFEWFVGSHKGKCSCL